MENVSLPTMIRTQLDGNWTLIHFEEGSRHIAHPDELSACGLPAIPAQVPGNVELDLMRAGELPDIYHGDNIHRLRPLESHEWWYRCSFPAPAIQAGQRMDLVFEGLDCLATVWLNGVELGTAANMLIAHRFDVTRQLRPGAVNELVVRLRSVVNVARQRMPDACESHFLTNWELAAVRKAPHMAGWDIAPRLLSAGIWRPVFLEAHRPTEIADLFYHTQSTSESGAQLGVQYHFVTDARQLDGFALRLTGVCGEHRFVEEFSVLYVSGQRSIEIPGARLWWPRGYGDAALYDVTCELLHDGKVLATRTDKIGLRTLTLHRTEVTDVSGGEFRFDCNGTPILVKGSNWVLMDCLHSKDADRYVAAMDLATDLGCNMLRCWGGNVYEDHAFFELCDAAGIMVWQDFAFACARYPQTADFLEAVRQEAEAVVRKLRNHPALAVWCGDNECDEAYGWGGDNLDPAHNRLTREVLPQVVHRCDPYRPFVPSSPYRSPAQVQRGGRALLTEEHLWGPRDYFKSRYYLESNAHFVGEIGYHGCPNVSSVRKFLDADKLWPWRDNSQWITHCSDPIPGGGPYRYRVQLMANQIRTLFGADAENLDDFALMSQISQAEAKKFFIEMVRLQKWRKTGVLWWNLIDGWPQFSDAVVDYYYGKKLAYHYIRRVQTPVCLMISEPADCQVRVVAGNDSRRDAAGPYRVWDADTNQTLLEGDFHAPANTNCGLGTISVADSEQRLFLLEWTANGQRAGNHYLLGQLPVVYARYRQWLTAIAALPQKFDANIVAR